MCAAVKWAMCRKRIWLSCSFGTSKTGFRNLHTALGIMPVRSPAGGEMAGSLYHIGTDVLRIAASGD